MQKEVKVSIKGVLDGKDVKQSFYAHEGMSYEDYSSDVRCIMKVKKTDTSCSRVGLSLQYMNGAGLHTLLNQEVVVESGKDQSFEMLYKVCLLKMHVTIGRN